MQMQRANALSNPQAWTSMDSMDIPSQVIGQFHGNLPAEVKKWRDLKAWLNQNQIPDHAKKQLLGLQRMQFRNLLDKRMVQPRAMAPGADQSQNGP